MVTEEQLREFLKKKFPLGQNGGWVANYGWVTDDNKLVMSDTHVCHAGLSYPKCNMPLAIVTQIMGQNCTKPNAVTYYNWLFNESPMSEVFISKDAEQTIEDGFIILNTESPMNVTIGACIMTRHLWETSELIEKWSDLVEAGVNKDGAFVLAHAIYREGRGYACISTRCENSNHTIFGGNLYSSALTNFIEHKFPGASKPSYLKCVLREYGMHTQISDIFTTLRGPKIRDALPKWREMVAEEVKSEVGVINDNPFYSSKDYKAYKYKELIAALAKLYPRILKEDSP